MEQRISFCHSADGVRIAVATFGQGPPLVYAAGWPTHIQVEWERPFVRRFLETLALGHTLIRYDMRGSGLSDHSIPSITIEALMADLEAVVQHLALDRFDLLSMGDLGGPTALAYAARHPERVSRLVLHAPYLRGAELAPSDGQRAMTEYTANFGFPIFDFTDTRSLTIEQQRQLREIDELAANRAFGADLLRLSFGLDLTSLAGNVSTPTLVLHGRNNPLTPFALGRDAAASIPNASFIAFDGDSASPLAHRQTLIPAIRSFLDDEITLAREAIPGGLSPRELDVLRLLSNGLSNAEIASRLTVSVRTVERHVGNIYDKLGVHSRVQAVAAFRGWSEPLTP